MLQELNEINGANKITRQITELCKTEFQGHLYGAEMGIAYGGGVEYIGQIWQNRGTVWGFDTFEGHPINEMLDRCEDSQRAGGINSTAASCMEYWYTNTQEYGRDKITYDFIRNALDQQNLFNVHLVKGLVTNHTNISFIPKLHYVLLDMDFPQAQWDGYQLVKDLIVQNGYLCLHDMIPQGHIPGCYERYQQILNDGIWNIVMEVPESYIVVLKKK